MRKRDREKIAKELYDVIAELDHSVLQQLNASAWYFENNADGFDFAYTSQRNLIHLGGLLKKFLDHAAKAKP